MEYFELKSDTLVVTDPCYNRDTISNDAGGIIKNCLPGKWFCFTTIMKNMGTRVSELHILHEKYLTAHHLYSELDAPFDVSVDSGQAGVFDAEQYPHGETGDYGDETTFYGRACAATEHGLSGVITEGFVSRSGFGDGGYPAFIGITNDQKCVSVRVVFIDEEGGE